MEFQLHGGRLPRGRHPGNGLRRSDGEVTDAYTSRERSTLCDEIGKLEVDLQPTNLVVLLRAKQKEAGTTPVSGQVFASDLSTRDQSEMIEENARRRNVGGCEGR